MHHLLFVYGALQDPDVLALVLGHPVDPRNVLAAVAPGHRAACLPGRTCPGLWRTPGATTAGQLLLGLSRSELELLDDFVGDGYRRNMLPVIIDGELHRSAAYLPLESLPEAAADWSFERWRQLHRQPMLMAERKLAEERRARLRGLRRP